MAHLISDTITSVFPITAKAALEVAEGLKVRNGRTAKEVIIYFPRTTLESGTSRENTRVDRQKLMRLLRTNPKRVCELYPKGYLYGAGGVRYNLTNFN